MHRREPTSIGSEAVYISLFRIASRYRLGRKIGGGVSSVDEMNQGRGMAQHLTVPLPCMDLSAMAGMYCYVLNLLSLHAELWRYLPWQVSRLKTLVPHSLAAQMGALTRFHATSIEFDVATASLFHRNQHSDRRGSRNQAGEPLQSYIQCMDYIWMRWPLLLVTYFDRRRPLVRRSP